MQSSMPILQKNYKFSKVFFWGKLMGMKGDYLIAKGIEESLDCKKFFFCTDGVSWSQLPLVTPEMLDNVAKVSSYGKGLSGDIGAQLQVPEEPLPEGEEPPEETPPPVIVTELERLAVMVEEIDTECAMCPSGAYVQKADHCIVPSPTFAGFDAAAAMNIANYAFLNKPKATDVNASALKQSSDFLTSCSEATPKGSLTCSFDVAKNTVTFRNLLYPGFYGYAVVGMPVYGYCYFGSGLKNADIAFMLP